MKRAQETPDAKPHPQPRMRMKKAYERSHHRFGRPTRRFLRNGFNGFFRDLPGDRAFLPPSPARRERPVRAFIAIPLTCASVEASGPRDFAVRVTSFVFRHGRVHRIPRLTFVTIAKRPSQQARDGVNVKCFGGGRQARTPATS